MNPPVPTSFPRKRILLLGASGKVGRMLRSVWAKGDFHPYEIIPIFRSAATDDNAVSWSPGQDMGRLPSVDAVLAFWGVTHGSAEDLAQNTALALEAEHLARSLGARCVVHCSSAAVYAPGADLAESAPTRPSAAYGQAKLDMEHALSGVAPVARRVILRIGSVAGAESLFGNLRPGQPITLDQFADGQGPYRSYIAPQDLARALEALVEDGQGVYNISAPQPVGMQDIAYAAGSPVLWRPAPETALQHVTLNTDRVAALCPLGADAADPAYLVAGARATGVWA